ncbi:DUF4349 domain-containing protein [Microbacterium candidum]|uniref:DUF4349 domain-containing protein n=1 Tax=Microbacterium candidum TaxID=3041922 RepID=A0ABT7N001_9MICO|nr:DUF4349 domain-containing protein [Microbacterium sp. ASV49]MDL9980031.1 DUF4349 domain-containing protein [Microbacterium sp. ASV49]
MTNETNAGLPRLPDVDDAQIDGVERRVFSGIARERASRRHRRRVWTVVGAVAAVLVVAIAIVPAAGLIGFGSASSSGAFVVAPQPAKPGALPNNGAADAISGGSGSAGSSGSSGSNSSSGSTTTSQRAVVTTATATLRVDDVRTSAARIGAAAKAQDGYVQSMNIGQTGVTPLPATGSGIQSPANGGLVPMPGGSTDTAAPPASGAWITVRVPADKLDDLVTSLAGLGQVEASTIDRQDVTDQTIDLQARVAASEASVARLTELMGKAGSVADLLAAESALADRQATLESEQQQLKALDDQVAMSTLTVTLLPQAAATPANAAGFGSGLVAGWNALVASLNGVVVVIGFLLPWLAVAAVIALIVWGIVVLRRRRRARPSMPPTE